MKNKRILLGKITKPHGIKGLVKVRFFGEDATLLQSGPLYTGETGEDTLTITIKNPLGKYILAQIEDVNDRTAAETLRGTPLYIPREKMPPPENGAYYREDLIGLSVLDQKNTTIGHVTSVENYGAGDLLEIKLENGPKFLLPVDDQYITDISQTITIKDYEDLLF